MALGEGIYAQLCAACHGAAGQGIPPVMPALAGNPNLRDAGMVIDVTRNGRGAMPPVGAGLSEEELKAVATFIRNSWGNAFGPVE